MNETLLLNQKIFSDEYYKKELIDIISGEKSASLDQLIGLLQLFKKRIFIIKYIRKKMDL